MLLVPRRRHGIEYLDNPDVPPALRQRSLYDVGRANALFGGISAVLRELATQFDGARGQTLTLLDVGTGLGDIPRRGRKSAARHGVNLLTFGLDERESLAIAARSGPFPMICGDALRLPIRTDGVDIALCSQLLHHFDGETAVTLLRELNRVARRCVIVSDIRRSWLAAAGIWLASFPLRFHPVSRHDGVASVLRGFTTSDLRELVSSAVHRTPAVRRRIGFRATAVWSPSREAGND